MSTQTMDDSKVFSSDIIRDPKVIKNNLYELINIVPAKPVTNTTNKSYKDISFQPTLNKQYTPKRNSKYKVKTVKHLRTQLERDVLSELPHELDKQENYLLRKIRSGTSNEDNTKKYANNIIKTDRPISRAAWQMLMNINPEGHAFSLQYVLWNGKRIQVNGSKGGQSKFICKYDLGTKQRYLKKYNTITKNKLSLLQNSLSIKFKPGPLTKKKFLDDSYQKYSVGDIELVDLPQIGLDIQPAYKVALNPSLTNFLHKMRDKNGKISPKWAEFSLTMLGSINNNKPVQSQKDVCVNFDLSYKSDQQRMLMRLDRPIQIDDKPDSPSNIVSKIFNDKDDVILSEVHKIINDVIDAVEINLKQDMMYTEEDDPRATNYDNPNPNVHSNLGSSKSKRKYTELEKLAVTVINLSDDTNCETKECHNSYCTLGCICTSLMSVNKFKLHCGRMECMFECKCDFFNHYRAFDSFHDSECPEFLPGLIDINNEINTNLAKEEKKFHQTVVLTGDKSILLKTKRRHWKTSKKYGDFYSNMCLKSEVKPDKILSIVIPKLNCVNIEPWCLVHNLYKCFCKGKFCSTSEASLDTLNIESVDSKAKTDYEENLKTDDLKLRGHKRTLITTSNSDFIYDTDKHKNEVVNLKTCNLKLRSQKRSRTITSSVDVINEVDKHEGEVCARVMPFVMRKYYKEYYSDMHKKIIKLEHKDKNLQKKLLRYIEGINDVEIENKDIVPISHIKNDLEVIENSGYIKIMDTLDNEKNNTLSLNLDTNNFADRLTNKTKLVTWLEFSYKQYKQRCNLGIGITLGPPKLGKVALYPWDFILSRYREMKNLFLISKETPFRIFMAIDRKHSFFDNLININEIRFAELHKYPMVIKNLLTNTTNWKDNFCILCGLSNCWEIIGSVTKIDNPNNKTTLETEGINSVSPFPINIRNEQIETDQIISVDTNYIPADNLKQNMETIQSNTDSIQNMHSRSSKWFIMTVENDFIEIQFYNKGFFVKYATIMKALNVARASGKTVRLSSQKCIETDGGPQFGIYAIPIATEDCAFVGPYEKDEALGIETVKNIISIRKSSRTRGIWISVNKADNLKLIDNPMAFMPPLSTRKEMRPLDNTLNTEHSTINTQDKEDDDIKDTTENSSCNLKLVKPIKIRKSDGFYHLTPDVFLKNTNNNSNTSANQDLGFSKIKSYPVFKPGSSVLKKPIAEIAPQVKIPPSTSSNIQPSQREGGMFILKPEEINKKLMRDNNLLQTDNNKDSKEMTDDIENFLKYSQKCSKPITDVFVISDDDESCSEGPNNQLGCNWKDVYVKCKNIDKLNWIRGRLNDKNQLSFEFPGFKYSDFYEQGEAFVKINQVLCRKVYVPKTINLEWEVVKSEDNIKPLLSIEELSPDFIMTKLNKNDMVDVTTKKGAAVLELLQQNTTHVSGEDSDSKKKSDHLEIQTDYLRNDTGSIKKDLLQTLDNVTDDVREIMVKKLQSIMDYNSD